MPQLQSKQGLIGDEDDLIKVLMIYKHARHHHSAINARRKEGWRIMNITYQ